eukprot:g1342.t1
MVTLVRQDSAAAQQGIRVGSELVKVDGTDVRGFTNDEVATCVRTAPRPLCLTLLHHASAAAPVPQSASAPLGAGDLLPEAKAQVVAMLRAARQSGWEPIVANVRHGTDELHAPAASGGADAAPADRFTVSVRYCGCRPRWDVVFHVDAARAVAVPDIIALGADDTPGGGSVAGGAAAEAGVAASAATAAAEAALAGARGGGGGGGGGVVCAVPADAMPSLLSWGSDESTGGDEARLLGVLSEARAAFAAAQRRTLHAGLARWPGTGAEGDNDALAQIRFEYEMALAHRSGVEMLFWRANAGAGVGAGEGTGTGAGAGAGDDAGVVIARFLVPLLPHAFDAERVRRGDAGSAGSRPGQGHGSGGGAAAEAPSGSGAGAAAAGGAKDGSGDGAPLLPLPTALAHGEGPAPALVVTYRVRAADSPSAALAPPSVDVCAPPSRALSAAVARAEASARPLVSGTLAEALVRTEDELVGRWRARRALVLALRARFSAIEYDAQDYGWFVGLAKVQVQGQGQQNRYQQAKQAQQETQAQAQAAGPSAPADGCAPPAPASRARAAARTALVRFDLASVFPADAASVTVRLAALVRSADAAAATPQPGEALAFAGFGAGFEPPVALDPRRFRFSPRWDGERMAQEFRQHVHETLAERIAAQR